MARVSRVQTQRPRPEIRLSVAKLKPDISENKLAMPEGGYLRLQKNHHPLAPEKSGVGGERGRGGFPPTG